MCVCERERERERERDQTHVTKQNVFLFVKLTGVMDLQSFFQGLKTFTHTITAAVTELFQYALWKDSFFGMPLCVFYFSFFFCTLLCHVEKVTWTEMLLLIQDLHEF